MKNVMKTVIYGMSTWLVSAMVACGDDKMCQETDTAGGCEGEEEQGWKYQCYNSPTEGNYFYHISGGKVKPNPIEPCVAVEPESEETEGWEAAVRAKCSSYCLSLNNAQHGSATCLDERWSQVNPYGSPAVTCSPLTALIDFDEIESVLGAGPAADAETLACDLPDSCIHLLDYEARLAMLGMLTSGLRNTAEELMETDPGQVSEVILLGEDAALEGEAAYTALSCSEDACPFYLAQFDLAATSSLVVAVPYGSAPLTKTVSNLEIGLARPALGMWLPDSDDIIFPPNALAVRITATVSGSTNNFGENGNHDLVFRINEFVYGTLDGGVLSLSHSGTDVLGAWSVEAHFIPE